MKCAMLFQDLFTTLHSSSMKTGLAWSHYINLRNISYLYKWDRYAQYNLSILIPVVLRCLFQAIPSLAQLLLQVIQWADYGTMLQISFPCLSSAADSVRTIDRISWYKPGLLFSVDGLTLFDSWDSITLQQPVKKRVIQSMTYHYTEFFIEIRPTNHDNWKICDKIGHYLHQGDPVLASPMPFSCRCWDWTCYNFF